MKNYLLKSLTFLNSAQKSPLIRVFSVLIIFAVVVYFLTYKLMPTYGIVMYNDAAFTFTDNSVFNIPSTWSYDYHGDDSSIGLFNVIVRYSIFSALSFFGISAEWISYLTVFLILYSTSLIFFFVTYKVSQKFLWGIFCGLFVLLNNLTLEHIIFGGYYYYFFGLLSVLFLLLIFLKVNSTKDLSYTAIFLIAIAAILSFQPFYFFIFEFIILFSLIYLKATNQLLFKSKSEFVFKTTLALFLPILTNLYWILPFIYSTTSSNIFFGASNSSALLSGFLKVSTVFNVLNGFQYFNFPSRQLHQTLFHYAFYASLFGANLFLWLKLKNNTIDKTLNFIKYLIFLYFIFLTLSIGPNIIVFKGVWTYLWDHISIFKFFRTVSRFIMPLTPIILLIFSLALVEGKLISKRFQNLFVVSLLISIIALSSSIFTGNLKGTILATKVPAEYYELNEYLETTNSFNSILALPPTNYERYVWGRNSNEAIISQDYFFKDYFLKNPVLYDRASLSLVKKIPALSNILNLNESVEAPQVLSDLNIKYVLIQKDLLDSNGKKVSHADYSYYFDKSGFFKKILSNENFDFYEVLQDGSLTSPFSLEIDISSPTALFLTVTNPTNSRYLTFNQDFSNNWKLYYIDPRTNLVGLLFRTPIAQNIGNEFNHNLNMWEMSDIQATLNSDISNKRLLIFFLPQAYFYLGIYISAIVIASLIVIYTYKRFKKDFV